MNKKEKVIIPETNMSVENYEFIEEESLIPEEYEVFFTPSAKERVIEPLSSIEKLHSLVAMVMELSGKFEYGSHPYECNFKRSEHYGENVGVISHDKKVIFRLDWDEEYGTHLNYENYEYGKKNSIKVLVPIDIPKSQYHSLIKSYNRSKRRK